jgi:hypothetical protein
MDSILILLLWIKVDSLIPINLPNLNPICHLPALGSHHILHVGRIRVNCCDFARNHTINLVRKLKGTGSVLDFLYGVVGFTGDN